MRRDRRPRWSEADASRRGFTLVDLLVVIAIVAILYRKSFVFVAITRRQNESRKGFALQQFKVPRYSVDLRSVVWPNGKTGLCQLAVKFGSTAVCDQMNLKSHSMALS